MHPMEQRSIPFSSSHGLHIFSITSRYLTLVFGQTDVKRENKIRPKAGVRPFKYEKVFMISPLFDGGTDQAWKQV